MICSFGNKTARDIFNGINSRFARKLPKELHKIASRKLDQLNSAEKWKDLKAPPSNHLEALKEALKGLHSIRINDQWRLVFDWTLSGAGDVQIVDYH